MMEIEGDTIVSVKIGGKAYKLEPEPYKNGCEGCAFISKSCTDKASNGVKLIDICRTGVIFKPA